MTEADAKKLKDWIKTEAPDTLTVIVCPSTETLYTGNSSTESHNWPLDDGATA